MSKSDEHRLRAFKTILDDIGEDNGRYRNKPAQLARVAELIGSQDLKLRPRRGEVKTPTAEVLREALLSFSRKGRGNVSAESLFQRGPRALDQHQKRKLGYPEEARTEVASSRSRKTELERLNPEWAQPVQLGGADSARSQSSANGGEAMSASTRPSAALADAEVLPHLPSTTSGTTFPPFPPAVPSLPTYRSALPPHAQFETVTTNEDHVQQARTDGTDVRSTQSHLEKCGSKRKHEAEPEDGLPRKRSALGDEAQPVSSMTSRNENDEAMPAVRGTKRKHEATPGDAGPRKRFANAPGAEFATDETSAGQGAEGLPVSSSSEGHAAVATSANLSGTSAEAPQDPQDVPAVTRSGPNESTRASNADTEPRSIQQPQLLNVGQTMTWYEQEPTENAENRHGTKTGPAPYPAGLNRVEGIREEIQSIVMSIESATHYFLKTSGMGDMNPSIPMNPCEDLAKLYKRIFCQPSGSWWKIEAARVLSTNITMDEWLSACVGAMIHEQVFLKPVPWRSPKQLLDDMKHARPYFERLLLDSCNEDRYRELDFYVYKSGQEQIDEGTAFEDEHVTPVATELASQCLMLVVQQMRQAKIGVAISDDALTRAMTEYTTVFKRALFLRGRCEVSPLDFEFDWPKPKTPFDREWMTEIRRQDDYAKDVQICAFPAFRARGVNQGVMAYFSEARVYCSLKPQL
ncbi:hypothetical protein CB0940_04605 [Cercospora beticola]|uniref:Uncharacterized protein n=1 Tax=Cercospora beticola TaxID=122368 RepID=A0A2G5HMF0_CERBT|nr:hypothetical protein CB0940_04605 [Cercospora beticola]PIA93736.1 hypothetical protein CB0940_04605 [Cercospora beticola]WPB01859.1 hypothetical protein RHO25_006491 [Cercospora beticola]